LFYFLSIGTFVKAQLLPVSRLIISQKEVVVTNNAAPEGHNLFKLKSLEKGTTPEPGSAVIWFNKVSKRTWLILTCKNLGVYKLQVLNSGGRINDKYLWVRCIDLKGKTSTWDFYYKANDQLDRLSFYSDTGLVLLF
jgi:hypothetical protein